MTTRNAVEFVDTKGSRCGNYICIDNTALPEDFSYKYLRYVSGPTGVSDIDMNTDSSLGNPSIFEYQVPSARQLKLRRINFELVEDAMQNQRFAGLASALANGCLLEIIDDNGITQLLDFLDSAPVTMNADFAILAGVDSVVNVLGVGDDALPIRFTIGKAGANMLLSAGRRIRFTVQDDLSSITRFRAQTQGIFEDI